MDFPFAILSEISDLKQWALPPPTTWRFLRELLRCVCLHLKTDLLLSLSENIIPKTLGD